MSNPCPCGSQQPLSHCCEPLHQGQPARSAEALMRSRYSAYALGRIDYLVATTLPVQQPGLDRIAMAQWSHESHWLGLEIEEHQPIAGQVEHAWVRFVARWQDLQGEQQHRERSAFVRPDGRWYFIDPTVPLERGRNDPCPCGGGLKFKKCCSTFVGT